MTVRIECGDRVEVCIYGALKSLSNKNLIMLLLCLNTPFLEQPTLQTPKAAACRAWRLPTPAPHPPRTPAPHPKALLAIALSDRDLLNLQLPLQVLFFLPGALVAHSFHPSVLPQTALPLESTFHSQRLG